MADGDLRRIRGLSLCLAAACVAFAVALPLAVAWYWAATPADAIVARLGLAVPAGAGAILADWQRLAAGALALVPVGLLVLGLLRARRCFHAFADGRFFVPEVVAGLRGFAAGAFGSAIAALLLTPALSVLLTVAGPQPRLAISVGSDQLLTLFVAGTVWSIAWVMARAAALAEENAQFV